MPKHRVVVVGASAGGIEALIQLLRALPADLLAAVLVALHYPPKEESSLANLLDRKSELLVSYPNEGEVIQAGHVYLAPPDRHMLINDSHIRLEHGPRENGFRPSIDPLFRSAADTFGEQAIGVILSGSLGDGVSGLKAIKEAGGMAIVQDPNEALFPALPNNAIAKVTVDHVLPVGMIAEVIKQAVLEWTVVQGEEGLPNSVEEEEQAVQDDLARFEEGQPLAGTPGSTPTMLTCPECGGVLWELKNGKMIQYRCHVGHTFAEENMLTEQTKTLEAALWTAVRTLVERAALLKRMAERAGELGNLKTEERFEKAAQEAEAQAEVIRRSLVAGWRDPENEAHAG
jgi:two-component system chemotaxis response regulator CheB